MARKRANPPEKKMADREASDFALTRAERRRAKFGREDSLAPYEFRFKAAEAARKEVNAQSIADRIFANTRNWLRRTMFGGGR